MQAQQLLIAFLAILSPFILSFLIVAILAPRFKDLAERKGWIVRKHPEDHRDFVFTGERNGIPWEMEYYIYEHYRKLRGRYLPFTNVIVWSTKIRSLAGHTLLIYPRRDRLKHFIHPRLTLDKDIDLIAAHEREKLESFLFRLPESTVGSTEFRKSFVIRSNLEALPEGLIDRLQLELLSWQKIQIVGPVILINDQGVFVWWVPLGMRNEWLEKTVLLGTSLAGSLQQAQL